jgi:hypothetical protein
MSSRASGKDSGARRSARGSMGAGNQGKGKEEARGGEEEQGDAGNIFERMKSWKRSAEKREERAWEQAIVALGDDD